MRYAEGVEIGEVKTLASCPQCIKPIRVRCIGGGEVIMTYHRRKRERCPGAGTSGWKLMTWSLQQAKVRGLWRKVWVRVQEPQA